MESLPYRKRLRLRTRFSLMVGVIVCLFCIGSATLLYVFLKQKMINDTYKRGQTILALMDSIGAYVGNTLRPKMYGLISHMPESDSFIVEAMSTTRIRHGVMEYLGEKTPEFQYYRVTENPHNPVNKADAFHSAMIEAYKSKKYQREWHGIHSQDGEQIFFYNRTCVCHK